MANVKKNVIHPFTLATPGGNIHFGVGQHEIDEEVAKKYATYIDAFCAKPAASAERTTMHQKDGAQGAGGEAEEAARPAEAAAKTGGRGRPRKE